MAIIPNSQKTFSVNEGVNTTYGGSASMKALSQWYTMQDITDTVRPYKVFSAMFTQGGGDVPDNFQWYGGTGPEPLVPFLVNGWTYYIGENDSATDFTICGAPSNEADTYFIANGVQPIWSPPYEPTQHGQEFFISLSWNEGAPVVTVLENTIGNVWFTYGDTGLYYINSNNLFTENKTMSFNTVSTDAGNPSFITTQVENSNIMLIRQFYVDGTGYNGINPASIEIRVYN